MHLLSTLAAVAGLGSISLVHGIEHQGFVEVHKSARNFQCGVGAGHCCSKPLTKNGYGIDCEPVPLLSTLDKKWSGHVCGSSKISMNQKGTFGKTAYPYAACCEGTGDDIAPSLSMQECHRPENGTHNLAFNHKGIWTRQDEGESEGVDIIIEDDGSVVIVIEDHEIVDDFEDELDEIIKGIEAEELDDDDDDDDDDFDDMGSVMLAGFVLPHSVPGGGTNFTLDHIKYTAEFTCEVERGYCCLGGLTSAGLGVNCKKAAAMKVKIPGQKKKEKHYFCQDQKLFMAPACCSTKTDKRIPKFELRDCPAKAEIFEVKVEEYEKPEKLGVAKSRSKLLAIRDVEKVDSAKAEASDVPKLSKRAWTFQG